MKHKRILALVMVMAVSASAFAISAFAKETTDSSASGETAVTQEQSSEAKEKRGKKEKVEEPENAVGKDAAKSAALKDAGLAEDSVDKLRSRVSKTDDGTVIYKVHFTANDTWYSYKIDALSGKVLDKSTQTAEEHEAYKPQGGHGKKEKVEEPESAVGKDAAKTAALKDAGLAEDGVEKLKAHVSKTDDGTVIYKVHFTANDTWYSYKIDALSGKVIDKSTQTAEEHEASKQQSRKHKSDGSETSSDGTDSASSRRSGRNGDTAQTAENQTAKSA